MAVKDVHQLIRAVKAGELRIGDRVLYYSRKEYVVYSFTQGINVYVGEFLQVALRYLTKEH